MKAMNKRALLVNLLGVIMARAALFTINPVAIAYFAAAYMIDAGGRLLVLTSTIVGLALWLPLQQAIQYGTVIILFAGIIKWVEKRQKVIAPWLAGLVVMLVNGAVGISLIMKRGPNENLLVMIGIEAILVFALYIVFTKGFRYLLLCKKGQVPNNEELISVVLLLALFVYAVPEFGIQEFSVEETISYLLVLVLGYKYGAGAGAITGASCGAVLYLDHPIAGIIGIMSILGIVAGVFRKVGKVGSGVAFLLTNIILGYFYEEKLLEVSSIRALASGTAVFMLLPKSLLYTVETLPTLFREDIQEKKKIQDSAKSKLKEFAESFKSLSKTFYQISETKSALSKEDVNFIFDELSDKLCKRCVNCHSCWQTNFYDTYKAAFSILAVAEQNGKIGKGDIPANFARQCINLNEFIFETNRGLEMAKLNMAWQNRMAQSREAIAGQFLEVASIIENFSKDLYESVGLDQKQQEDIIACMKIHHLDVKHISVVEKRNCRQDFFLTLRTKHGRCITTKEAATILGEVLHRRMKPMEGTKNIVSEDYDVICFVEDTNFKVLTGMAKLPKTNETVSGDNYSFLTLSGGECFITLSDGMGSGEQASIESQAVIELLERFMEAGFKEESAIKLINSMLVMRTDQQICSTIDMSVIDLHTGMCNFIKIGAAATFIKRKDWVEVITSTTMPIGILNDVDMDGVSKKLYDGDYIIMVSDGVLDCIKEPEKEQYLSKFISRMKRTTPQQIAEELLEHAVEQNDHIAIDDMTVLVAGMWKKQ